MTTNSNSKIYFRNLNKVDNIFYFEDWTKEELELELSKYTNHYFGLIFQTNDYRCCCRNGSFLIKVFDTISKEIIENYWINNITDSSEIESIEIYNDHLKLLHTHYNDETNSNDILYWGKLDYKSRDYKYSKWYGKDFEKIYNNKIEIK